MWQRTILYKTRDSKWKSESRGGYMRVFYWFYIRRRPRSGQSGGLKCRGRIIERCSGSVIARKGRGRLTIKLARTRGEDAGGMILVAIHKAVVWFIRVCRSGSNHSVVSERLSAGRRILRSALRRPLLDQTSDIERAVSDLLGIRLLWVALRLVLRVVSCNRSVTVKRVRLIHREVRRRCRCGIRILYIGRS